MILLGLILFLSSTFCQSSYLEETAECARNSSHVQHHIVDFFLGCHSFKQLIARNHVFIDKTLLLRELFKEHTYLTIFYLPPKFSKTTNLEMIRFFTESQLDSNDSIIPYKQTTAYNFFALGKILYENDTLEGQLKNPPLISRHMDLIDQHVAQHPAIYFDFGTVVRCIDYGCSWGGFRDNIGREFKRYKFLTSRISPNDSSHYTQLFDYFNRTEWAIDSDFAIDLPSTVIFLAKMASKFFQKKPILYIDEYDSLLGKFLHRQYLNEKESGQVLTFFGHFIEAVFSRDDIWHRIILTGTHGIHSNIMSSLEGSKAIYNVFDNNLSHFFGFTEADVSALSKHFPRVTAEQQQQIREYYNGYQMNRFHPIYNPWCIMNSFTTRGDMINHWEKESEYKWFLYNLWGTNQLRSVWLDLLSDRANYLSRPLEKFSHEDLWTLRNTLYISMDAETVQTFSLSSKEFTQALMYQFDTGYLTWANYDIPDRDTTFNLRAPNLETRKAVFDDMRMSYRMFLNLNVPLADNVTAALHSYLFSRQREKFIDILTRSFDELFKQTRYIPKIHATIDLRTDPIVRHIIEYIGLSLRYQHDHKLDRNMADGFVASKSNVSSVVIFNCNQSVENEHILNQIDNLTHPWTELGPEMTNSSVTYVVIGVKNGTEISIRRYGAEPPVQVTTTTKAPVTKQKKKGSQKPKMTKEEKLAKKNEQRSKGNQTTRVGQSPKTKKSKSWSQFKPQVTKPLNFTASDFTKSYPSDTTSPKGSKFSPLITKSLEDFLTNQTMATQVSNESATSEPTKHHIDTTKSIERKSTNTTISGLVELLSTTSMSKGSKSSPEFTPIIKSPNNSDQTPTSTSQGSKLTSEVISAVTKPLNDSFITDMTITQVDKENTDIHVFSPGAKSTQSYAENTSFSTIAFAEDSLKEITRVTRSVSIDQSPPTPITSGKSKSGFKSKPKFTKSSTIEMKVTDSDAAANQKTPKLATTVADAVAVESSAPVQPSPPESTSTLTSKIDKLSKEPSTISMKAEPSTTPIKQSSTITSIKDTSITSSKDTSISEPQTNPSDLTTIPSAQQSISEIFSTQPSKSGSKSTKVKVTRPQNRSTFTKRKKGKNFNATAFVRGNFTKATKFSRVQKSFVMTTITATTTTTTTPSTTTESTTTEMTFFPTRRQTRVSYARRSRTGSRIPPKTTTISAMQFWKRLLHIH